MFLFKAIIPRRMALIDVKKGPLKEVRERPKRHV
jgi:hypothetical protein